MCSEKKTVRRRPDALIPRGEPSGPRPPPLLKRKHRAAVLMLPSHVKKPRQSNQGPIESARQGTGLCISTEILIASDRNSTQLFTMKETAVSGHTTEKSDR